MKRHWLLFSQTVTIWVAIWFVVATLKPQWLNRRPVLTSVVPVFEVGEVERSEAVAASSYSTAAKAASGRTRLGDLPPSS